MILRGIILLFFLLVTTMNAGAQTNDEEIGLAQAFGDEDFISLATGSRQLITRAPAVASVITAQDIKAMGATDLDQVLETVPGLHVSVAPRAYSPLYTIRGIYTENNPQVLVLINDIPITNVFVGNRSDIWGGMPVQNISRIEVIRGPGSAVHGADAFAGTINIVTKTASDIDGTEIGGRKGSFDSGEGWLLHGSRWRGYDTAFFLDYLSTDGADNIITNDAQTFFDGISGTNATLAPGPVNLKRDNIDARLDISKGNWKFRMGYQGRYNIGTGAGVAQALDPTGSGTSRRLNADITYHANLRRNWDVTSQISYFNTSAESQLVLFPPGTMGPNPFNTTPFPQGMIGNPDVYEKHYRINLSAFYHGIDNHTIRLGTGFTFDDMYKIRESKNYDALTYFPLGSLIDVSNDPNSVFIQPHTRDIAFVFVQDEWSVSPDWDLTGGIRYDHYSDFGSTVNPRLALVWQTSYNLTSKLLYGRAFRAPSFQELYNINNPVALGNPNLKPETINTIELAFDYRPAERFRYGLNVFSYEMQDILRFVGNPAIAENKGNQTGYGLEIEADAHLNPMFELYGNYAYQHSTDDQTDAEVANAPAQQLYIRMDWRLANAWYMNAQINAVADRSRAVGDTRPAVDNYSTTDLILRYKWPDTRWELAAAVKNLFDNDIFEPSPGPTPPPVSLPPLIPNDLPLAGRTWFLEARYSVGNAKN